MTSTKQEITVMLFEERNELDERVRALEAFKISVDDVIEIGTEIDLLRHHLDYYVVGTEHIAPITETFGGVTLRKWDVTIPYDDDQVVYVRMWTAKDGYTYAYMHNRIALIKAIESELQDQLARTSRLIKWMLESVALMENWDTFDIKRLDDIEWYGQHKMEHVIVTTKGRQRGTTP